MAGCAYPRSSATTGDRITRDTLDGRCGIRVVTIRRVVTISERRNGNNRCIHVSCVGRHERPFVAEVAVAGVVAWISNHLPQGWRARTCIQDWARIVHARDLHGWCVTGWVGRIDLPRRKDQSVVDTPLIGVNAGNLHAVVILNRYRRVWHSKLLAESGRGGVKFGRKVIRNEPGEVSGSRRLSPHEEVRLRLHLVFQSKLLAIAEGTSSTGKGRHFPGFWRHAHEIWDDAKLAHTRRRHQDECARSEAADAIPAKISCRIGRAASGPICQIGVVDGGLVGHDEDVAEAAELLCDWRDIVIANQDVLIFLLGDLVVRWRHGLDHVLAGLQHCRRRACVHRSTQGRVSYGRALYRLPGGGGKRATSVSGAEGARKLVQAIVGRRLYLIEVVESVEALVLRIVRQCGGGI